MRDQSRAYITINSDGCIQLPKNLVEAFGLKAGVEVVLEVNQNEIRLLRPISHLARVYIEPTNSCSLSCRTCVRNIWDEPQGFMRDAVFERLLAGLEAFSPRPLVFFGGYGEPLSHPKILEMISRVKESGSAVELITNGILLNDESIESLVEVGLDVLWVSVDGAHPDSYADIRLGAELPHVLQNLERFVKIRDAHSCMKPQLGLAFVAMQRNIKDLPELLELGNRLRADYFSVSNLIAHTAEFAQEVLYKQALYQGAYQISSGVCTVNLPRMDLQGSSLEALRKVVSGRYLFQLAGCEVKQVINRCPFISKGSTAVRWDGLVSPCLPLLYSSHSFLDERLRVNEAYHFGSILNSSLLELWNDTEYVALRERLRDFDFSPCTFCNSCEMAGDTVDDCFGNEAPTCGGCLWSQGIIQCP
jgi:MoaA/NifB/PqqE/SkfB family radical SAM enzyme